MKRATIVAFLQNQWFPAARVKYVEHAYAKHAGAPEGRAQLNARYLFFRCLTGQRLRAAFGDLCDDIVWENASPKIATESSGAFVADADHIGAVVRHFRPVVVLTFGRLATLGVDQVATLFAGEFYGIERIASPHPAARYATVPSELAAVARRVRDLTEPATA